MIISRQTVFFVPKLATCTYSVRLRSIYNIVCVNNLVIYRHTVSIKPGTLTTTKEWYLDQFRSPFTNWRTFKHVSAIKIEKSTSSYSRFYHRDVLKFRPAPVQNLLNLQGERLSRPQRALLREPVTSDHFSFHALRNSETKWLSSRNSNASSARWPKPVPYRRLAPLHVITGSQKLNDAIKEIGATVQEVNIDFDCASNMRSR